MSQRGGAPGTREPICSTGQPCGQVNAIVLSGEVRSASTHTGRCSLLENEDRMECRGRRRCSNRASAILFDLGSAGSRRLAPPADCGYRAAQIASESAVAEGNVGAGAGATLGKVRGPRPIDEGGMGSAAITLPNGLTVAALVAVNAIGDVIDPATGQVVAGVRTADGKSLADARKLLRDGSLLRAVAPRAAENTTIAVVATNARLTKTEVNRVALMPMTALASAEPAHTIGDGDTVFALATAGGQVRPTPASFGALAADVLARPIVLAATQAQSLGGLPSAANWARSPRGFK